MLDFPFICNAVCVLSEDGTHGIIGCDAKGFCCKTCRYDKHECIHVGALQKYILNDETEFSPTLTELIMMNEGMVETVRRDLRINLISRNKLPFKLSPSESAKFRVHITNKFAIGDDGDYILVGNSSGSCLSCGSSTDDPDADITVGQTCSLHTLKGIYSCKGKFSFL